MSVNEAIAWLDGGIADESFECAAMLREAKEIIEHAALVYKDRSKDGFRCDACKRAERWLKE